MKSTLDPPPFRPELLSEREREVVDLAILGRTDEQIAQSLSISVSTVNSYWVRIRGKIGFINRTEIVAKMLISQAALEKKNLLSEVERLSRLLYESDSSLLQAKHDLATERRRSWHLLALHFAPQAILVAESPGLVYANAEAERLFRSEPGEMAGYAISELTVSEKRVEVQQRIQEFMDTKNPGRMVLGVEEPYSMQNLGGESFPATITMDEFETPDGFMIVLTLRKCHEGTGPESYSSPTPSR